MKTNNSLNKIGFVLEHILWAMIAWMWYKNILFRCLPSRSFMESKLILWGIVIVFCIAASTMELKNNRNGVSVFFNLVSEYGIYTVLAYYQIRQSLIVNCLLVVGIISVIYSVLVISRKIKNRKHLGRILCRRILRIASMTQKFIGVGLAFIMVVSGIGILFGSTIMKSGVSPATQANINEQSLSNNMETIAFLQDDSWNSLTVQERLDVLQTVANVEQRYLGIPNELNVGVANLNEGVLGYYSDKTHEIVISMDSLLYDSSWEVLDTVCHEAYHSYQHRVVEALHGADEYSKNLRLFRKAKSYADEFNSYISGEEDFCSYYFQDCESDAREYAENAVCDYYLQINEYLTRKGE